MSKIACLFPGQGSQSVGMGKDLFDRHDAARQAFETIDSVAGRKLSQLCFAGPEEELKRTINTQPTILAVSIAAWKCYEAAGGPKPDFVAGHSLGEFSALVAAQSLSIESAVKLVEKRAGLMESCPKGAMSAVIGMKGADLEAICASVGEARRSSGSNDVVIVANFNTHEQLVISGTPDAVKAAGDEAKAKGAKVIPLPVGGAFHSPLMSGASSEFQQFLKGLTSTTGGAFIQDAQFAVVQNVDAKPSTTSAELTDKLLRQMSSSVRWTDTIEYMLAHGVTHFIEIGPGKALAGMVKKINRQTQVFNISDTTTLEETLKGLRSGAPV